MQSPHQTNPSVFEDAERRRVNRLLAYWMKKKGANPFLPEGKIDPDELGDVWNYCFVVQVRDIIEVREHYNYTYLGDGILSLYADGALSESTEGVASPKAMNLHVFFSSVLESKAPAMQDGSFTNLHHEEVKYRQCLLPLGEGDEVEAILGVVSFGSTHG